MATEVGNGMVSRVEEGRERAVLVALPAPALPHTQPAHRTSEIL